MTRITQIHKFGMTKLPVFPFRLFDLSSAAIIPLFKNYFTITTKYEHFGTLGDFWKL